MMVGSFILSFRRQKAFSGICARLRSLSGKSVPLITERSVVRIHPELYLTKGATLAKMFEQRAEAG